MSLSKRFLVSWLVLTLAWGAWPALIFAEEVDTSSPAPAAESSPPPAEALPAESMPTAPATEAATPDTMAPPAPAPDPVLTEPVPDTVPEALVTVIPLATDPREGETGDPGALPLPAEEVVINTGDAASSAEVTNIVNVTRNDLPESNQATTTATSTNEAEVTNEAAVTAETGQNQIEGAIRAFVNTGDAVALANVLNLINVNITDSTGWFLFLNQTAASSTDLDFRQWLDQWVADQTATSTDDQLQPCPWLCGGGPEIITNTNQATTTNDIVVEANTGENQATSTEETVIETGDAYAAANVINVVNTNITDSNYLLLTFNHFGDWGDDIVLPAAELFARLFNLGSVTFLPGTTENTNEANVANQGSVTADTGGNQAVGENATINTGDAWASFNVLNQLNNNFAGFDSFSLLIQIHGDWSGEVFNAPPGLTWQVTPQGLQLIYQPEGAGSVGRQLASLSNANDATIENNISVVALTGRNQASSEATGTIETGDAYAAANVINIVNNNIVGRNWLMALVNIFGDWDGNVSFGRPDLWIGEGVSLSSTPLRPGGVADFRLTIKNNGDAPASRIIVRDPLEDDWFEVVNSGQATTTGDSLTWEVASLRPGESAELTYQLKLRDDIPYGEHQLTNDVAVSGRETDNNPVDNADSLPITVRREPPSPAVTTAASPTLPTSSRPGGSDWDGVWRTAPPQLKLAKTHDAPVTIQASSTVDYKIVVTNDGTEAFDAVLLDQLSNPSGQVIHEESWPLDTVYPGEEITFNYTMFFSASSTAGVYINRARVEAFAGAPRANGGTPYLSPVATSTVVIAVPPLAARPVVSPEVISPITPPARLPLERAAPDRPTLPIPVALAAVRINGDSPVIVATDPDSLPRANWLAGLGWLDSPWWWVWLLSLIIGTAGYLTIKDHRRSRF